MRALNPADVYGRVNRTVDSAGGASAVARRMGVSRQALSAMLNGKARLAPALLAMAGVRRVERYELIEVEPVDGADQVAPAGSGSAP